eukprot:6034248-Amphidinium_carterae.1
MDRVQAVGPSTSKHSGWIRVRQVDRQRVFSVRNFLVEGNKIVRKERVSKELEERASLNKGNNASEDREATLIAMQVGQHRFDRAPALNPSKSPSCKLPGSLQDQHDQHLLVTNPVTVFFLEDIVVKGSWSSVAAANV